MPVASRKGNAGLADTLAGRIVRARGACEYPGCGRHDVVWAHDVPRRYSATRCLEDNAWALCGTHHDLVDTHPHEKVALAYTTIGQERYDELWALAHAGHPGSAAVFWSDEVERLKARCRDLGLSDKRAA